MYNDCAVEMEPEYVGNHEDLKVQAPWGHLQTKSCFCYYILLFLNGKQFNLRLMHLQTLSHIPFASLSVHRDQHVKWTPLKQPRSLHLCAGTKPAQGSLGHRGEGWQPERSTSSTKLPSFLLLKRIRFGAWKTSTSSSQEGNEKGTQNKGKMRTITQKGHLDTALGLHKHA